MHTSKIKNIDPGFIDLGTSWSCKLHEPAALLPVKEPLVFIGFEIGLTPSYGLDDKEK
jgi:hypothetical protein